MRISIIQCESIKEWTIRRVANVRLLNIPTAMFPTDHLFIYYNSNIIEQFEICSSEVPDFFKFLGMISVV
jgi:hypothetical protein